MFIIVRTRFVQKKDRMCNIFLVLLVVYTAALWEVNTGILKEIFGNSKNFYEHEYGGMKFAGSANL